MGRATLIVLILPMLILAVAMLVALFFLTEGDILAGVSDVFPWGGQTRKKEESGVQ